MNFKQTAIAMTIVAITSGAYFYYANYMEREVSPDYQYIKYVTMDDGTQIENRIFQRGETLVVKSALVGSIKNYEEAAKRLKANNHSLEIAGGCSGNCIYLVDIARKLNVPVCAKPMAIFTYQRPSRVYLALEKKYLLDSTLQWIVINTNEVDNQPISAFVDELPGNFQMC